MITLIAAAAENNVIGCKQAIPWHIPADFAHFKRQTSGKPVVMGRKTYESIGRPLPQRVNIIVTRQADYAAPEGVQLAGSLQEALACAAPAPEVMIIGGASLYEEALPLADKILLTRVHSAPEGDTYFPEFSTENWECVEEKPHPAEENRPAYTFQTWVPRQNKVE